jgi:hypothetical protein
MDIVRHGIRPSGALLDPSAQTIDLLGGEAIALRRHALRRVGARDLVNQQTGRALAGDDRRARIAAADGIGLAIETETAALLLRPVTAEAAVGKHGPDVAREV